MKCADHRRDPFADLFALQCFLRCCFFCAAVFFCVAVFFALQFFLSCVFFFCDAVFNALQLLCALPGWVELCGEWVWERLRWVDEPNVKTIWTRDHSIIFVLQFFCIAVFFALQFFLHCSFFCVAVFFALRFFCIAAFLCAAWGS